MNVPTFIFLLCGLTFADGQVRKIIANLNPGCWDCDKNTVLLYVQAIGSNDTIHQIWDFTGVPTVIYAIGSLNSSVTIDWWNKEPTKFSFSERPSYSFAFAIDRLYEYNDVNDKGQYDPSYEQKSILLSNLSWQLTRKTLTNDEAILRVEGKYENGSEKTGFIDIKLSVLPFPEITTDTGQTINSTLVTVRLVDLKTTHKFNSSRFALRFLLISNDNASDSWNYSTIRNLDNKNPKIFGIVESHANNGTGIGGFLQFHPVAYTKPERGVSAATNAYVSGFNRSSLPTHGILKQFYQDYHSSLLVQDMYVSFGDSGDGFYGQHNFTSWYFRFGYGTPSTESVTGIVTNTYVYIIISVILCLVLSAVTGVVIFYRKFKRYKLNGEQRKLGR